jgi:hypothetical protein
MNNLQIANQQILQVFLSANRKSANFYATNRKHRKKLKPTVSQFSSQSRLFYKIFLVAKFGFDYFSPILGEEKYPFAHLQKVLSPQRGLGL